MKGVIFDFNGTMFDDTYFHDEAWIKFIEKYSDKNKDEINMEDILGRDNKTILKKVFKKRLNDEDIKRFGDIKEKIYRDLCRENLEKVKFVDGLLEFIEELNRKNIPNTIATSAPIENIDFYYEKEILDLGKYFNRDMIVYEDGSFNSKPSPDIYKIATKKIGIKPQETLVFEDSIPGITAAYSAGVGYLIVVDPNDNKKKYKETKYVDRFIENYKEINVGEFKWEKK